MQEMQGLRPVSAGVNSALGGRGAAVWRWTRGVSRQPSPSSNPLRDVYQPAAPFALPSKAAGDASNGKKRKDPGSKLRPVLKTETVPQEVTDFWMGAAEWLQKHHTTKRFKQLDLRYPFGISPKMLQEGQKPPCFDEYLRARDDHPKMIVLCRIGDFHEVIGMDALILSEYLGLNLMGGEKAVIPKAGFHHSDVGLHVNLQRLTAVGHSVVPIIELPLDSSNPSSGRMKQRSVVSPVTPARPVLLYDRVDSAQELPETQDVARPILGIAATVSGHKLIEVNVDMLTYTVHEGLTNDSVVSRIHKGGMAPPLYIHLAEQHGPTQLTESSPERRWAMRAKLAFKGQVATSEYYHSHDPLLGLLNCIRRGQVLDSDAQFNEVKQDARERPKALFQSTADQLGLHQTRGVSSLLDKVLPSNAPVLERAYTRGLLLEPPPAEVAASIRTACEMLSNMGTALPSWTVKDSNYLLRFIREQQCNVTDFRDLSKILHSTHLAACSPDTRPVADLILQAVALECPFVFDAQSLGDTCREVKHLIDDVIEEEEEVEIVKSGTGEEEAKDQFVLKNEGFMGKVKARWIKKEMEEVTAARDRMERAYKKALLPLLKEGDINKNQPKTVYEPTNNALWIKVVKGSKAQKAAAGDKTYITPRDRNSKAAKVKDMVTTAELEEAGFQFTAACGAASLAVRDLLQKLAARLEEWKVPITAAAIFNMVASALEKHVAEALRHGWVLPRKLPRPPPESASADKRQPLRVEGMWPYWLEGRSPHTVRNSLEMSGIIILTGPNMAGKSTIMRSLCAVALLASCGLYAPCEDAEVPFIDAFMLRTFSMDSPIDGQSSFGIEMDEADHAYENATSNSLVLVDELAKGTEIDHGICIAASFLEHLDATGCLGVFSTHLHGLLDMDLKLHGAKDMHMETVPGDEALLTAGQWTDRGHGSLPQIAMRMGEEVPTWKIRPGPSRKSLAFPVMAQYFGENHPMVVRARELHKDLIASRSRHEATSTGNGKSLQPKKSAAVKSPEPAAIKGVSDNGEHTLEAAGQLLKTVAAHCFERLSHSEQESTGLVAESRDSDEERSVGSSQDLETQVVLPEQEPPLSVVGRSCVYIIMTAKGWFYAGETDDLRGRLATHRKNKTRGGPKMQAVYVMVPSGLQGKSAARDLETQVITALERAAFPLSSASDARRKRSPRPQK